MISVIVPIYNVEKYLIECIESIIKQSYIDLEIILVDDGSTDNCGQICDAYEKKDHRIKVIHKKNGGLSSARNAGIATATGAYYTFIDSDDYVASDMIEQLFFAATKNNSDISACSMTKDEATIEIGISKKVHTYSKEQALSFILREKKILTSAWGKLYKKCLFDNIRYPDGMIYEDFGTTYKLVDSSNKIAFTDTKKYYYRNNPKSITKSNFTNKQLDYYIIAKELQNFLKQKYPQYSKYAVNHSIRMSISSMRKISQCGFKDEETIQFLVSNIRANILRYLFSGYSIFSKLYGVLVCISPKQALSLFYSANNKSEK